MVGKLRVLLVVLLCLPLVGAWPNTGRMYPSTVAYVGPGDVLAGAVAWYGMRAFNNTQANAGPTTNAVIDVLGVSTVTGCTIYLKGDGTGDLDFTTAGPGGVGHQCLLGATTFCTLTNTNCTISKWYDTSGASACTGPCPVNQTTAAQQPLLVFNCISTKPCARNISNRTLSNVTSFAANYAIPNSLSSVSFSTASSGTTVMGNSFGGAATGYAMTITNEADMGDGATFITATYSSPVKAARNEVENGASSVINLNGTETTGTANTASFLATTAPQLFNGGGAGFGSNAALSISEVGLWGHVGFSGANRTALCKNQQSYYVVGSFGAAC